MDPELIATLKAMGMTDEEIAQIAAENAAQASPATTAANAPGGDELSSDITGIYPPRAIVKGALWERQPNGSWKEVVPAAASTSWVTDPATGDEVLTDNQTGKEISRMKAGPAAPDYKDYGTDRWIAKVTPDGIEWIDNENYWTNQRDKQAEQERLDAKEKAEQERLDAKEYAKTQIASLIEAGKIGYAAAIEAYNEASDMIDKQISQRGQNISAMGTILSHIAPKGTTEALSTGKPLPSAPFPDQAFWQSVLPPSVDTGALQGASADVKKASHDLVANLLANQSSTAQNYLAGKYQPPGVTAPGGQQPPKVQVIVPPRSAFGEIRSQRY